MKITTSKETGSGKLGKAFDVIGICESQFRDKYRCDCLVRSTRVDFNDLLEDEAQFHCGPSKYERSQKRVETFSGILRAFGFIPKQANCFF